MNPNNPFPYRCLAQLYERAAKDPVKAKGRRDRADKLREQLTPQERKTDAPEQDS